MLGWKPGEHTALIIIRLFGPEEISKLLLELTGSLLLQLMVTSVWVWYLRVTADQLMNIVGWWLTGIQSCVQSYTALSVNNLIVSFTSLSSKQKKNNKKKKTYKTHFLVVMKWYIIGGVVWVYLWTQSNTLMYIKVTSLHVPGLQNNILLQVSRLVWSNIDEWSWS